MRNHVKRLRRRANLRQQDLADLSGVTRRTIANVELGTHIPRAETMRRILAAFGLEWGDRSWVFDAISEPAQDDAYLELESVTGPRTDASSPTPEMEERTEPQPDPPSVSLEHE